MKGCQVLNSPPTQPEPEPATLSGPQISEISAIIEKSDSKLMQCYLDSLELWPQLEGSVVIKFTINASGSVENPAVAMHHSTVFDPSVGCCIARVAQTWQFPKPADSKALAVEYPFDLVRDALRFRIGTVRPQYPFTTRFTPTLIIAPPQPANGAELHRVY